MRHLRSPLPPVVAALVALVGSCVTPSIPIPPPDPEKMVFGVDTTGGTSTFRYPPEQNYADAIVYVFNRTVGEGVITTAHGDGSVAETPAFPAHYGDEVNVTFEAAAQVASTCVVLRASGPIANCL